MRHHIKVKRVGRHASVRPGMRPHLHEAVAGIGVVEPRQDDDFEFAIVAREMPVDAPAEIALPDVEHEADGPEHVRFAKLGRVDRNCVEMPFVVRTDWATDPSAVGRQIKFRRAQGACIDAIRIALVDREDEAHPLV
jgi:hypothetical protein